MLRVGLLLCTFALGLVLGEAHGGSAVAQDVGAVEEIMQADRDFAAEAGRNGIDGWMSFMTEDAARMAVLGGEFVSGHEAIRAMDSALLDSEEIQLVWSPARGYVFADGTTGLTTGAYEVRVRADGSASGSGRYLTLWRRTEDGWKVAFDTGVATN